MTDVRAEELHIGESDDVVRVRQIVRDAAVELGFSIVDQTKVVTAASELARNTYTYGGGGRFRAELLNSGSRHGLRLIFEDDGPGIPERERDNVFRPFYRLDHARNQDEGNSGLGLAIARDIAKSHGGEIALGESSMGGLRAIISLPQ